jgi:ribosomal protein S27AE
MNDAMAYVWLDVVKAKLIGDAAPDKEIKAIEYAQRLIREKITGYAEEDSFCPNCGGDIETTKFYTEDGKVYFETSECIKCGKKT